MIRHAVYFQRAVRKEISYGLSPQNATILRHTADSAAAFRGGNSGTFGTIWHNSCGVDCSFRGS